MRQLKEKPTKKRVGFLSSGAPARAGFKILDVVGNEIGVVTSGCPAPSIKGMGSVRYEIVSASSAAVDYCPVKTNVLVGTMMPPGKKRKMKMRMWG